MAASPPNMGQETGISLHLTITVAPEKSEEFLSHFKPIFDVVTAEADCTYFEVFQNPSQPGTFQIVENWSRDLDWFMTVCVSPSLSLSLLPFLVVNFRYFVRVRSLMRRCGQVQLKKEYYKPYIAATEPLWTKPREFKFWERMPIANGLVMSKPNNFK